jgi:predicted alpha/beta superfamily hydrolase
MHISSFIITDPLLFHDDWHCIVALPNDAAPAVVSDSSADTQFRRYPVVYLMGETDVESVMNECANKSFILVGIESKDWNTSFSPWPVPRLAKNLGPFSGGGPAFLELLINKIKLYVDAHFATIPDSVHTALAGYSLAGLLTAYAVFTQRTVFSRFACMSGSLWYPGWIEFMEKVACAPDRADTVAGVPLLPRLYFSLGDREKVGRNQIMAQVESCTQKTVNLLERYNPVFEMNAGGHFDDVCKRIAKGICAVLSSCVVV